MGLKECKEAYTIIAFSFQINLFKQRGIQLKNSITKEKQSLGMKKRGCHDSSLFIKENVSFLLNSFSKGGKAPSLEINLFNRKTHQVKNVIIK